MITTLSGCPKAQINSEFFSKHDNKTGKNKLMTIIKPYWSPPKSKIFVIFAMIINILFTEIK